MEDLKSEIAQVIGVNKRKWLYQTFDLNAIQNLQHKRYAGGHALTKERFDYMIEWIKANA